MIKWTTPSLKCTVPSNIEFDYILLTLTQGAKVIEKTFASGDIVDGSFTATFTQEETGSLSPNIVVNAQLNIMKGEQRLATNIEQLQLSKNLHDEIIGDLPSITFSITENGTYSVGDYQFVEVNIEQGIFPSGTLEITENGTYDVSEKAEVSVNVSASPSGTLLWTNPDPSQKRNGREEIADYNILENYNKLRIIYQASTTDTTEYETIVDIILDTQYPNTLSSTIALGGKDDYVRGISFFTKHNSSLLDFGSAKQFWHDTIDDSKCIPLEIYYLGVIE